MKETGLRPSPDRSARQIKALALLAALVAILVLLTAVQVRWTLLSAPPDGGTGAAFASEDTTGEPAHNVVQATWNNPATVDTPAEAAVVPVPGGAPAPDQSPPAGQSTGDKAALTTLMAALCLAAGGYALCRRLA